jgi:hypothetical protein
LVLMSTLGIALALLGAPALAADATTVPSARPLGKHPGQNGGLSVEQDAIAQAAWKYFENNYQQSTCLYNSVDGYPSATMWDTASAIAALVAAHEFNLIYPYQFDERMSCLLASLAKLDLFREELPNKAYNTTSLAMVDYNNKPGELGFSAIDIGRLLTWLAIVKERYPAYADTVDRVVLRWKFCNVVDRAGTLYGAVVAPNKDVQYVQEGRLGYEEYAAKGFQLWGFSTDAASAEEPYEELGIYGVPIAYDSRDPAKFGAHNYVVTEAYLLQGLEMNWDDVGDTNQSDSAHSDRLAATLAKRVYDVQENRYKRTGTLTARSEHQIDGAPYFVYDTIYSDGVPWNTISDDGHPWPDLAAISTKAALGMSVLFDTPYTAKLVDAIAPLVDPDKGLYEGMYEKDGKRIESLTANTNGIVLETLLYKIEGKLYRDNGVTSIWNDVPNEEYPGNWQCLPNRQPGR